MDMPDAMARPETTTNALTTLIPLTHSSSPAGTLPGPLVVPHVYPNGRAARPWLSRELSTSRPEGARAEGARVPGNKLSDVRIHMDRSICICCLGILGKICPPGAQIAGEG